MSKKSQQALEKKITTQKFSRLPNKKNKKCSEVYRYFMRLKKCISDVYTSTVLHENAYIVCGYLRVYTSISHKQ